MNYLKSKETMIVNIINKSLSVQNININLQVI